MSNIRSILVYQILQYGTAVLIGVLMAKLGVPTGVISQYEALTFLASLFCFFWVAGGQNALLQLYPKLGETEKKHAVFQTFAGFTGAGLLTGGVLFFTQPLIAQQFTNLHELPNLGWLSLFLVFHAPSFLVPIFYQLLKKHRSLVVFGAVSFALQLAVVVVPLYLGQPLEKAVIGLVCWAAFKYAWLAAIALQHGQWSLGTAFLKKYWPLTGTMVLFALIGKGTEYVNGLVAGYLFEDEKTFAVFRFGSREFPLAVLMVNALITAITPEIAEHQQLGTQRIKDKTRQLSHLLYPLSMASMLAAPFVFPLLFNPDFQESARIFNIFTLLLTSRILLPNVVSIGYGKHLIVAISATAELVVLVVLSLWWGQWFGTAGLAFAAVVAFGVDRIMLIVYNQRVLGIPSSDYVDWKVYFLYNSLLLLVFLLSLFL